MSAAFPARPRIAVINWRDSSHPQAGGAEVYCENVARELTASGASVTYVTARAPGAPRRERRDGYEIRRMGSAYGVYPLVLLWLFRTRGRLDGVIDSQNGIPFFSPLAVGRRVPVALVIHHVHQAQFALYLPAPAAALCRWLESTGTRLVYGKRPVCVVSPSSRTEVRRLLRLLGPIFLLPNGSGPVRQVARSRSAHPSVVCVGRLVPHKRWHEAVAACVQARMTHADLTLDVMGGGPCLDELRELVVSLGAQDYIRIHGFVDGATRDRMIGGAWLTVSASAGEGWGLSIIEAAAQGVPAVATDVPGLRDSVVDGETGWLMEQNELGAGIVDAVKALADPAEADAWSSRCRSWAAAHTWEATAQRFRSVLGAERGRMDAMTEVRAVRSDTCTVITLTQPAAMHFDLAMLRGTDQSTFCPSCVGRSSGPWRVLLSGSDEIGALQLLERSTSRLVSPGATIRLCRSGELLAWPDGAPVHNAPAAGHAVCPAGAAPRPGDEALRALPW